MNSKPTVTRANEFLTGKRNKDDSMSCRNSPKINHRELKAMLTVFSPVLRECNVTKHCGRIFVALTKLLQGRHRINGGKNDVEVE